MKFSTLLPLAGIVLILWGCQKESIVINNLNTNTESAKSGGGSTINLTQGLLAFLPFSGNANDATGNGYNGTVVGAKLTTDRAGRRNSAYYFDGASNYISIPAIDFSGGDKMSLSCWIKFAGVTQQMQEIYRQEGFGNSPDIILSFQNNATQLAFGLTSFNTYPYSELDILIDKNAYINKWHHIAAVYDGSNKYLYVDGIKLGTESRTGNLLFKSSVGSIGNRFPTSDEFFYGSLDEFRFYNRALTQTEISYLATR